MSAADADSFGGGDPRAQLSLSRDLARRVRHERRATWFPLLVFALVTFLAIPVLWTGHPTGRICRPVVATGPPGLRACVAHNSAAFVYWPIALIVAYIVIAGFYLRLSHTRGLDTRIRPYVITGLVLAVALIAASVWAAHTVLMGRYVVLGWQMQGSDVYRLVGPACAIGLALLVLAAIERSPALLVVTLVYLVIAIGGVDFGWTISQPSRWAFAPRLVISGSFLLLASVGFAMAQLPPRHIDSTDR